MLFLSELKVLVDDFLVLMGHMRDNYLRPAEQITRMRLSPGQFHAVSILRARGPLPMRELAAIMRISKQQLTPLICKLIDAGLAERRIDQKDRRIQLIDITAKGRDTFETLKGEIKQAFTERLAVLPEEEIRELAQLVKRIHEILKVQKRQS